jgi:hypothetical protein
MPDKSGAGRQQLIIKLFTMKTEITLTVTKECAILCDIFGFGLEDLLRYYMKQVSLSGITANTKPGDINCATLFFIHCIS